jgi:type III secretory pathway component EscU
MSRTSNNIFQLQRTNPINSEKELTSVKKVIDFFKSDSILIILLKLIKDPFKHEFFLFSIRVNSFLLSLSDSSSFIENLIELLNHIC